jgi:hypothetical protein
VSTAYLSILTVGLVVSILQPLLQLPESAPLVLCLHDSNTPRVACAESAAAVDSISPHMLLQCLAVLPRNSRQATSCPEESRLVLAL